MGGTPGNLTKSARFWNGRASVWDLQPIDHHVVSELIDELIYNPVNSYCATDKLKLGILRIAEDEMVGVELRQILSANSSCQLYYC